MAPSSDIYGRPQQQHLSAAMTNETKSNADGATFRSIKLFVAAIRLFTRMAID